MSLYMRGMASEKHYSYNYSTLHYIRYLACKADGYKNDWNTFNDVEDLKEEHNLSAYPHFWQLLHFCDAEGVMVPDSYLEHVEYKESYYLGSSTKLLEELEFLKEDIARYPEKYENEKLTSFWTLYDLVKDEVEEGYGILFMN